MWIFLGDILYLSFVYGRFSSSEKIVRRFSDLPHPPFPFFQKLSLSIHFSNDKFERWRCLWLVVLLVYTRKSLENACYDWPKHGKCERSYSFSTYVSFCVSRPSAKTLLFTKVFHSFSAFQVDLTKTSKIHFSLFPVTLLSIAYWCLQRNKWTSSK